MPAKKKAAGSAKKKAPSTKKATKKTAKKTTAKKTAVLAKPRKSSGGKATLLGFKPYKKKRGEEFMGDEMREHFCQILHAWKHELMEEVDRTVHHMQDEAANFPDPNDRATQESEFSLELRTRDRERKLIKKIDESLFNLDANDYGFCESCGVDIGVRRLEARPTATQCIDCKTLDEIREKQMSG